MSDVFARDAQKSRRRDAVRFVERYDARILGDDAASGGSVEGLYNVGLWTPGVEDQAEASSRLVDALLVACPRNAGIVVDIGCGVGGVARYLSATRRGLRIVGINISLRQLQACQRCAPLGRFVQADASQLALRDACCDFAISVEAALHFPSRRQFLHEAFRVLKPGAVIAASDMLVHRPELLGRWMVPEGNSITNLEAYRALWFGAGFTDVQTADRTSECWHSYCRHMLARLAQRYHDGMIPHGDWKALTIHFESLRDRAVASYVLVSARRPPDGAARYRTMEDQRSRSGCAEGGR